MENLEDFMDSIEHLPPEVRTILKEMEETDKQVKNGMDGVKKKVNTLFSNANNMSKNELKTNFNAIMKEGEKYVEKSEEKVKLAKHMHENLTKCLSKLDMDIQQFKMKLEADNNGITEIIEKRCLDAEKLDMANRNKNKHSLNRRLFGDKQHASNTVGTSKQNSTSIASNSVVSNAVALPAKRGRRRGNSKKALSSLAYTSGQMEAGGSPAIMAVASQAIVATKQRGRPRANSQKASPSLAHTSGHMGAGGSPAIVASASQAIVATKQLSQKHKTAGLKASLNKVNNFETPSTGQISSVLPCVFPSELPIVKELAGAAHSVSPNMDGTRKYNGSGGAQRSQSSIKKNVGKPIDPNELRYCVCNQVAFGTMVACDYKNCVYEWYHCECVGVKVPPKGKWYCPECSKKMKSRRSRKPHKLN